jgi:ribosomal protein L7/L12
MINIELTHQEASVLILEMAVKSFGQNVSVLILPPEKETLDDEYKRYKLDEFFTDDQWRELIEGQTQNKIKLVKIVRALSGESLFEAKRFVEQYI